MDTQHNDITYERSLSVRAIIQELKALNHGKRKAYCRFCSRFYSLGFRPLVEGAEKDLGLAAQGVVQQVGGRLVRFAAGRHFIEVDMLLPADVPVHRANVLVRRATSRAYKLLGHTGIGSAESNGYLWQPYTSTQTLPPLLEKPERYNYETI